ncbi:MAG: hypothetical protein ACHQ01_10540 [Candidatus Limnocylindrales bacterium]
MSDPIPAGEERRLRDALRAEEEMLPLRLVPEDLVRRWGERRRRHIVRRLQLVAALAVVAVVALGAAWSIAPHGPPPAVSAPPAGPIGGPISVTPSFSTGPGLSTGRATLSLSQPESTSSSFSIGCEWSVHGHVVGLAIGKQLVGGDYPFLRWSLALGPKYEIEFVEPDQTTFIGSAGSFASQGAADGHAGSITFTNLVLDSGDPSTAPRRSGSFSWTCEQAASLGSPAPSLPSPTVDEHGAPTLWILQNGVPGIRALTGCPIKLTTPAGSVAESCATSNWWEPLASLNSALAVSPGDSLAFALDGWTVTSAQVDTSRSTSQPGSIDNPLQDLHAVLGNGAIAFSPPGPGSWYVHFTIEAAMDNGSTLDAEYSYAIKVA